MLLSAQSSPSSSSLSVSSFRALESLSFPCCKPHSAFPKPNIIFLNPNPERFSISSSSSPHPPSPLVSSTTLPSSTAPVLKKRKRYRKPYPGESEGIVQEMRFVAIRLRNDAGSGQEKDEEQAGGGGETWQPSMEGFLKYLVDSKLVFETVERIVDESTDVARKNSRSPLLALLLFPLSKLKMLIGQTVRY
ncbi:hypothetical protein B296_00059242 [Ensete ventricosum]|uniref:Uncharacterized protein n=1 Tax=Ensete ventricosum TaxID=4639 RepID=A0A426XIJ3_ENSVE|nr:hypothetical protein B296_00059242 [Ensete ventricosum]